LILEQAGHHLLIPVHNAGTLGMIGGQFHEQLGHADWKPAIAATPVKVRIGGVKKQAVGLLKFIEIGGDMCGGTVEIDLVVGGAIGFGLQADDHEHVIDQKAGLISQAVGSGIDPLTKQVCNSPKYQRNAIGAGTPISGRHRMLGIAVLSQIVL
jgi:hypothetical protein